MRYQYIHQDGYDQSVDAGGSVELRPKLTAGAVTPRVGLLWHPQSWISLYSNAENFGANQGKIYLTDTTFKSPQPTDAQQWEVGVKTELFDGHLRATLTYYGLTKQNVATADPAPNHFGGVLVTGEVRSREPELDIQGEILPGWNVIATYANADILVTKATVTNYPGVGNRYYGVPRNTGSLWSTYEFQQNLLKGFKFGGGVTLRDAQIAYNSSDPNFTVPGYATIDLLTACSVQVGKAKITAQMNINNLLDENYLSYANVTGFASGAGFVMEAMSTSVHLAHLWVL